MTASPIDPLSAPDPFLPPAAPPPEETDTPSVIPPASALSARPAPEPVKVEQIKQPGADGDLGPTRPSESAAPIHPVQLDKVPGTSFSDFDFRPVVLPAGEEFDVEYVEPELVEEDDPKA